MANFGRCAISSGSLNVRASASSSGTILYKLEKDEVVTILGTSGTFYYINHPTNGAGYASQDYMTQLSNSGTLGTVTLSSGSLNVRTGPGTTFAKATSLANGTSVRTVTTLSDWSLIIDPGASFAGWCQTSYITSGPTYGPNYGVTLAMVRAGTAVLKFDTQTNSDAVRDVQTLLRQWGESCTADGIYGNGTVTAVSNFQSSRGLTADGITGKSTLQRLEENGPNYGVTLAMVRAGTAVLKVDLRTQGSSAVRELQQLLSDAGYPCGSDGTYGNGVATTVSNFQSANGLTADGIFGKSTLAKLEQGHNSGITLDMIRAGGVSFQLDLKTQSNDIRQVQQWLQDRGFYNGALDGIYGYTTENAVSSFQGANGLTQDGKLGKNTLAKLEKGHNEGITLAMIRAGGVSFQLDTKTTSDDIRAVQQMLKDKGYYSGALDGVYGNGTMNSIMTFQNANGLTADGKCGKNTLAKLEGPSVGGPVTPPGEGSLSAFLAIARNEIGYEETVIIPEEDENYTKYGVWYGANGSEWCAMFVSWCANGAGILDSDCRQALGDNAPLLKASRVPKHALTRWGADKYAEVGRYKTPTNYQPQPGDIIYFYRASKGRIGHVGIVESYDAVANKVYTIEGNSDDAVRQRVYTNVLHASGVDGIAGYGIGNGIGNGTSDPGSDPVTPPSGSPSFESIRNGQSTLQTGAVGSVVEELQNLLTTRGFTCGSDTKGTFAQGTKDAVMSLQRANGLGDDGVVGQATLAVLEDTTSSSDWRSTKRVTAGWLARMGFKALMLLPRNVEQLNETLNEFGIINTRERLCHFLSQSLHECRYGATFMEDSYTPGVGGTKSYSPYYGAGMIQNTHQDQYRQFAEWLMGKGLPYEQVYHEDSNHTISKWATQYVADTYPILVSGWFWTVFKNINAVVDANVGADIYAQVLAVTRKVYGNYESDADEESAKNRQKHYEKALTCFS